MLVCCLSVAEAYGTCSPATAAPTLPETSSPPTAVPQPDKPAFVDCISELFSFHLSASHWISDDGRADHINCRVLLWKTLEKFPEFAESRSKVLVPIFLRFVEREVTLWEESLMQHQSIHQEEMEIPNSADADAEHGVSVDGVEGERDEAGNEDEAQTREGGEEDTEEDGTERELGEDGERMERLRGNNGGTVGKEARRARSTMRCVVILRCHTLRHLGVRMLYTQQHK